MRVQGSGKGGGGVTKTSVVAITYHIKQVTQSTLKRICQEIPRYKEENSKTVKGHANAFSKFKGISRASRTCMLPDICACPIQKL